VSEDEVLSTTQRDELASFAGVAAAGADDEALLEAAAERIGMTGEMSIDPDGVVELVRGDIMVSLEAVTDEDRELVDHPDQLQLAVFLRPSSGDEREELEDHGFIDPPPGDALPDDEWAFAAWGAMCTRLSRSTGLPRQMEVLERAMTEAERVMEDGELDRFRDALSDLLHDDG
jgi:hypothetical protein